MEVFFCLHLKITCLNNICNIFELIFSYRQVNVVPKIDKHLFYILEMNNCVYFYKRNKCILLKNKLKSKWLYTIWLIHFALKGKQGQVKQSISFSDCPQ